MICQKCFDGFVGECACTEVSRPWEAPTRDTSRKPAVTRPSFSGDRLRPPASRGRPSADR